MAADRVKTSKFLSLVLRHQPEAIGLALDPNGWANVDELLRLLDAAGRVPVAVDDEFENAEKVGLHLVGPDA